jgi:hypothetical protein
MVEQVHQHRLGHPDIDPTEDNGADRGVVPYGLPKPARTDAFPEESVPLFLSDYDGEPDPSEYVNPLQKRGTAWISGRVLTGVLAAAALAVLFALLSSDASQDIVLNFKSSIAAVLPAPSAAAQSDPSQLTPRDRQLSATPQPSAPGNQTVGVRSVTVAAVPPTAAVAPTREEIKSAYQSALQNGGPPADVPDRSALQGAAPPAVAVPDRTAPQVAAPPVVAVPERTTSQVAAAPSAPAAEPTVPADAIHQLNPNEIASLLRRGDALIASGDLAAARLVMRRAADAGDARAAMTLAETYDPAILEKLGVYGFVPDIAMARHWYEKAKKFGAREASQRLELLASKQH